MRRPLLLLAVVLFVIAALSAFMTSVNVNEIGFIALGLAAVAGDQLTGGRSLWPRPTARARRGARRLL